MLVVETIAKIRRAYFQDGKSIRQICRDLRVSRKTVRKVIGLEPSGNGTHSLRRTKAAEKYRKTGKPEISERFNFCSDTQRLTALSDTLASNLKMR